MKKITKMTLKKETILLLQERPVQGGGYFLPDTPAVGPRPTSYCAGVCGNCLDEGSSPIFTF